LTEKPAYDWYVVFINMAPRRKPNPPDLVLYINTTIPYSDEHSSPEITLPLMREGWYNCIINWGDGTVDHITNNGVSTTECLKKAYHKYATHGEYKLTITGQCNGWSFQWALTEMGPKRSQRISTEVRTHIENLAKMIVEISELNTCVTSLGRFRGMFVGCDNMCYTGRCKLTHKYISEGPNPVPRTRINPANYVGRIENTENVIDTYDPELLPMSL
jgi:hypothetical protein